MNVTQRFCPACQERFDVDADQGTCPRCGKTWQDWMLTPTVDSAEIQRSGALSDPTINAHGTQLTPPTASHARELEAAEDELLGTEFDKYHIHAFLGQGGMARVYRAEDLALKRPCAIKVLRASRQPREAATVNTFLDEARSAAALMHPHVVTIHTIGRFGPRHFIEMEYIDGPSVADHLHKTGPFEPLEATSLMLQICSALEAAHALGMVHRDIKPANVMIARGSHAKLADFGLAKRIAKRRGPQALLSGTPAFMSPELFQGRPASKASDIYAMGVTFFCLLTGRLPLAASSVNELMRLHQSEQVAERVAQSAELPSLAIGLIQRCVSQNPEDRFADAEALSEALHCVFGSIRSLGSLLAEALADEPVEIQGSGERFELLVRLAAGRSQRVVAEIIRPSTGAELIRIYSLCGEASADQHVHALELNAVIAHGALAIEAIDGQQCFVAVDTYPRATCDPPEVRESVMTIARNADRLEAELHPEDRY